MSYTYKGDLVHGDRLKSIPIISHMYPPLIHMILTNAKCQIQDLKGPKVQVEELS